MIIVKNFQIIKNLLLFLEYMFIYKKLSNHIIELYYILESYMLKPCYNDSHQTTNPATPYSLMKEHDQMS